jgi:peptide/nickel transport system permease protein
MTVLMRPLVRRLAFAPVVVFVITTLTYATTRLLRPDLYGPNPPSVISGTAHDVGRVFLHFDFGVACNWRGCPPVRLLWERGLAWDLWLLAGGLAIGVGAGVAAGMWCASRPRSLAARILEGAAMVLFCAPVFVVALLLLKLFNPDFGMFPIPYFFDAEPKWVSPWGSPWDWFRQLLVPWLVLAAPLGAMCLRLTLNTMVEALDEDFVRTATAKGISRRQVVVRHAGPLSYVTTASFVGISVPLLVTNLVLVERTLAVPGFLRHTWKALGSMDPGHDRLQDVTIQPDFPMLAGLTVWSCVLIVVLGLISDAVLPRLDPRIRAGAE